MRHLYLGFDGYDKIFESMEVVNHMNTLAAGILKRSGELVSYWKAKSEKMKASIPGVTAKRAKMDERIEQVKDQIIKLGKSSSKKILIDRAVFDNIFIDYTPPTKRKYTKIIEDQLSKTIITKK